MTETKERETKGSKPLTLSASPRRLELKKTVETGQVRQSFSHGRSKTVQVEVRKKRTYTRKGDQLVRAAPEAEAPMAAPAAPKAVATPQRAETEAPAKGRVVLRQLTDDEKSARARALQDSKRLAAEARKRAEAEAKIHAEEEAQRKVEEVAATQRQAEEEERKRADEEAAKRGAEEAAKRFAEEEAGRTAEGDAREADRARRPGRQVPGRRVPDRRGAADRRRAGKLTISEALDGGQRERQRSIASLRRRQEREKRMAQGAAPNEPPKKVVRDVVIPEQITVGELANRMAVRSTDVIKALMKMGAMATINQSIDGDTAELLVAEFGHRIKRVADSDVEVGLAAPDDETAALVPRSPVVTVMGHVDHGKTSLLDALRHADVVSGEAGGITQHIGAYQVSLESGQAVTFVDTPGHEAFTSMRARGAKVTDLVVLVVAADDSVMPQTIEGINHARAAGVPIIVAINKCDKPDADPERVRRDLLQHEIVVEEMGGDVLDVEVSAVTGDNLDKLVEAIVLQAELLELRANPDRAANGAVVEAKLEQGRGPVATVLVQGGTLHQGDIFVAGAQWGRVLALINDRGEPVQEAGPSTPVEVLGIQGAPEAGDEFHVVDTEARAREVADFRQRKLRDARAAAGARGTLEQMLSAIQEGEAADLAIVVKGDVQGSVEAIVAAAERLSTDEVRARILHSGVGGINESDVSLAEASAALIMGFNVRANKQARDLARQRGIEIRYYTVIYELIDDVRAMLTGMLKPAIKETVLGGAEVRQVFAISKLGKIAGCLVTEGLIRRGARYRQLRDNVIIHEGRIATLKHFKEDVREVKQGSECGMSFENYQDIQEGDVIEAYELEEVARTL